MEVNSGSLGDLERKVWTAPKQAPLIVDEEGEEPRSKEALEDLWSTYISSSHRDIPSSEPIQISEESQAKSTYSFSAPNIKRATTETKTINYRDAFHVSFQRAQSTHAPVSGTAREGPTTLADTQSTRNHTTYTSRMVLHSKLRSKQ